MVEYIASEQVTIDPPKTFGTHEEYVICHWKVDERTNMDIVDLGLVSHTLIPVELGKLLTEKYPDGVIWSDAWELMMDDIFDEDDDGV